MNFKKLHAFTLAEVLVTLTIIGVIAAMTIPTLNQNTKKNEYVAGCLKAYSSLSQAIDRMKSDYGPVGFGTKWNNADVFWMGENSDFKEGFVAQLNVVKACKSNQKGCFWEGIPKQLNGTPYTLSYDGHEYNVRTTDGMSYNFATADCGGKGLSTERSKNCMGRFLVDVNGDKGPNRFGYDIFFFALIKGEGIVPAGIDNNASDCTKDGLGSHCAAKVVKEKRIDYNN